VRFRLPATGAPGTHLIDLYPTIYRAKDPGRMPRGVYSVPQLTYADDHPGEDLPAFRYAFEVTADGKVGQLKPSSTVGLTQAR